MKRVFFLLLIIASILSSEFIQLNLSDVIQKEGFDTLNSICYQEKTGRLVVDQRSEEYLYSYEDGQWRRIRSQIFNRHKIFCFEDLVYVPRYKSIYKVYEYGSYDEIRVNDAKTISALWVFNESDIVLLYREGGRIIEIDEKGGVINSFGGYGDEDGKLKKPEDIFYFNRSFYVADEEKNEIVEYSREGKFKGILIRNTTKPHALAVDEKYIFVVDDEGLKIFTKDGVLVSLTENNDFVDIEKVGNVLYVGSRENGTYVYNITIERDPKELAKEKMEELEESINKLKDAIYKIKNYDVKYTDFITPYEEGKLLYQLGKYGLAYREFNSINKEEVDEETQRLERIYADFKAKEAKEGEQEINKSKEGKEEENVSEEETAEKGEKEEEKIGKEEEEGQKAMEEEMHKEGMKEKERGKEEGKVEGKEDERILLSLVVVLISVIAMIAVYEVLIK